MAIFSVAQEGGVTVVTALGPGNFDGLEGVVCLNPGALPENLMHEKRFCRKRVYLGDRFDEVVNGWLKREAGVTIGMNGYTRLTAEQCAAWGVQPGAYEKACGVFLAKLDERLSRSFPEAEITFVHGAAGIGVDSAISQAAKRLGRRQLGFNCPEYMFYVPDDEVPVYVADNVAAYSDAFVRACDILVAANGREQAFQMDIAAAIKYSRHFMPVNIIRLVSATGGPPALRADGSIEDAVAHYEQHVHSLSAGQAAVGRDAWASAVSAFGDMAINIGRRILPPHIGLEISE